MQSQRRDPHRGDHIVRQTVIFPFEVLFTTTNSIFCDIYGFFSKLLLLRRCQLIKFNVHCLQKQEGCCLPLALPFFFFFNE